MYTKDFLKDAFIRAIKTFFQTGVAIVVSKGAVLLQDVDWLYVLSASILAACVSLGMSFGGESIKHKK